MVSPEVNRDKSLEELVNKLFDPILKLTPSDKTANWAEDVLGKFNSLPKTNSRERKVVKNLVVLSAAQLLQAPQHIDAAGDVWKTQESLYGLIKKESKAFMRGKWEEITSEQLAQLVRIYANNPQFKDFAKELLANYFKGPKSRRQRIDAYYTFTSCVLDLVGDDRAFSEGVKIGLHDTDILPKDPHLIEQSIFLSLPYSEEKRVFQKSLISKYIMIKLSTMGSEDLRILSQKENKFVHASDKLKIRWEKEQEIAEKRIGRDELVRLNKAMNAFEDSLNTLFTEKKDKDNLIQRVFLDETDPLNQKFKEVVSRMAALKTMVASKE